MSQTSDTPLTDAAVNWARIVDLSDQGLPYEEMVCVHVCREIERELNAAKAQIEKLKNFCRHSPACTTRCYCGLSKLLEEIKA